MVGTNGAISVFESFKNDFKSKLGGQSPGDYVTAHPGEHVWATWGDYEACGFCGIVRRADGSSNTCKGITRLGLR